MDVIFTLVCLGGVVIAIPVAGWFFGLFYIHPGPPTTNKKTMFGLVPGEARPIPTPWGERGGSCDTEGPWPTTTAPPNVYVPGWGGQGGWLHPGASEGDGGGDGGGGDSDGSGGDSHGGSDDGGGTSDTGGDGGGGDGGGGDGGGGGD